MSDIALHNSSSNGIENSHTIFPANHLCSYQCPKSKRPLFIKDEYLCDKFGERLYSIEHNVPVILNYASSESEEDRERLNTLNKLVESVGVISALKKVHGENSSFTQYVTDASRCMFFDLLPMDDGANILEIGSGLGQFTPHIARRCGHVSAIEVVKEQAFFTLKRCIDKGCKNVSVAASGDSCFLPFKSELFDGVILNLVLEWCGMRERGESHEVLQSRMLSEIFRVLKPGGFAFIATKNRYALRYVMGNHDGHAYKIRFGNALPRSIMNLLLRFRGKKRPLGLLHSHPQFIRLIQAAGFNKIEPYWAVPDMRRPERYILANTRSIRAARKSKLNQGQGIVGKVTKLIPSCAVKYVAYGNVAIAYK
jgi:ubiquinone/menaquinone biosynthesis C-methylase UbiE